MLINEHEYEIKPEADLHDTNLSGANLSGVALYLADLSHADLHNADLSFADLSEANLNCANLIGADLYRAKLVNATLYNANLNRAYLGNADLHGAEMIWTDLHEADLSGANLRGADMWETYLAGADLSNACLRDANLRGAYLSGAKGLLSPSKYLSRHFEPTSEGIIAYKQFGVNFDPPDRWEQKAGAILTDVCDQDRRAACSYGINVATLDWLKENGTGGRKVWKVLIPWEWAPGIVVPLGTDGKIRCDHCVLVNVLVDGIWTR